jgi:hypothetical protein
MREEVKESEDDEWIERDGMRRRREPVISRDWYVDARRDGSIPALKKESTNRQRIVFDGCEENGERRVQLHCSRPRRLAPGWMVDKGFLT